jgi:hypothetical protein
MDKRWAGRHLKMGNATGSLFTQFTAKLRRAQTRAQQGQFQHIDMFDYNAQSQETSSLWPTSVDVSSPASAFTGRAAAMNRLNHTTYPSHNPLLSARGTAVPAHMMAMPATMGDHAAVRTPSAFAEGDELSAISNMLMEPQFTGLDRVVSFEEMMLSTRPRST